MPTLEEGDEGERAARVRILQAQPDEKEMAVDRELSPLTFSRVTSDDSLFASLVEAAYRKGRNGKRFLKKVRQQLLETGDQTFSRIKILEQLD